MTFYSKSFEHTARVFSLEAMILSEAEESFGVRVWHLSFRTELRNLLSVRLDASLRLRSGQAARHDKVPGLGYEMFRLRSTSGSRFWNFFSSGDSEIFKTLKNNYLRRDVNGRS